MKAIETELERVKRRQTIKNQRLEGIVEGLAKDIGQLVHGLEFQENSPSLEESSNSRPSFGLNTTIRRSCEEIVGKKNVRSIQNIHKDHFTFMSKLGKTIERELVENCSLPLLEEKLGKRDLLEFLDCDSMTEPQIRIRESDSSSMAGKLLQIQDLIEQKNYEEAYQISISNTFEDQMLNENLSFELMKLSFLNLVSQGRRLESIGFLQKTFQDKNFEFAVHYGEMISLATYKDLTSLPKRLTHYNLESTLENCRRMISKRIRKTLGLPEVQPLQEVICAGLIALSELSKEMTGVDSLKIGEDLAIQLHLPTHMVHHSVIYCPITRECCHEDSNRALYQNCGHVVGEHSVKKMMESNKKNKETDTFKCPTCPNQQRMSTMKEVHY
jgi:hypothetical protein